MTSGPVSMPMQAGVALRRFVPALALACGLAGAAEPLRHDPFAWPAAVRPVAAALGGGETPAPGPVWRPKLRAIVNAGSASLVSIDGTVVALGAQIDGYRLVRVGERSATFAKNGTQVELKMDGDTAASR